jgi:hypothetical protein
MATITGSGNYLVINDGTINVLSIPKGMTVLRVDGDYLEIEHDGKYRTKLLYSDVTNPSAASAALLRVAVKNIINT